ncbi:MAG: hypothetical protein IPN70_04030 [Candidatus Moraniibacteriota bacterium]|nr:MAG: hypothetical protein IPN70_04030 [Candidatus Moranbacteria bacterium]
MNLTAIISSGFFFQLGEFFDVISVIWVFVLPFAFYYLFMLLWMDYVNDRYAGKMSFILLEITPPQNIEKSPQPMEALYSGMAGAYKTPNVFEQYLDGFFVDSFSLEFVGSGGKGVHFYIRTPKQFQHLVEAHLYAQYPEVEILEVEDYIHEVPPVIPNDEWDIWGSDFELTEPDPMPIKTYRHFEEDVTGKMIDPLAGLIEIMGQLTPEQHLWLQYIITPVSEGWSKEGRQYVQERAGRVTKKPGFWDKFIKDFFDVIKAIVSGIFSPPQFSTSEEKKDAQPLEDRLTPMEKRILEALEGNVGKNVFQVKMRMVYVGKKIGFDKATFVSGLMGGIKQFSDMNYNGLRPEDASKTYANYIMKTSRLNYRQRKIFNRYRDRDPSGKRFIFSTEELATVFHLPDMAVISPFFRRVSAKRGSAPINLPF